MKRFKTTSLLLLFVLTCKSQVENGLVAKYTFNNANSKDETGKNNAKTGGVSLVEDRFGNHRSAYYLHGNYGSYLNLGTSQVLKPKQGSISLWFKIDNVTLGGEGLEVNPIILTKCQPGDDFYEGYFIGYDINLGKIVATTTLKQLVQVTLHSSKVISVREWHHIVICYDDTFFWLYIDDVLENDNKPMSKSFSSRFLETDSVMIGNSANTKNKRFLNGSIDDIRIYNRVISANEVKELFTAPDPNRYNIIIKWLLRILLGFIIVFVITWFIIKRYKRELQKEKENNQMQARLNEMEIKAIKSQMNPHFIFNSLNTIQRFILEEDLKNAHSYLTKFSKLLRKLLESGVADTISLVEEIDILNKYLEIEKLRFDNSFEYIVCSELNNPERIQLPFMLVQPFAENAIWHGLLPKNGIRKLEIKFLPFDEKRIMCIVEDNGIGREYAAKQIDSLKKKSLAIDFVNQRLDLLGKMKGTNCFVKIIDKKSEKQMSLGTKVEILIPILN